MLPESDYRSAYEELDETVEGYHNNFEKTFNIREENLIRELESRATKLKEDISELKKQTSQETIDLLIAQRKLEKEIERRGYERDWRELTEKLKKLEEEEKKLTNQNTESLYDIENMKAKIYSLAKESELLEKQIYSTKENHRKSTFLTQPEKKCYESPYKNPKSDYSFAQKNMQSKFPVKSSINQKLKDVRTIQKIPSSLLIEFLSRKEMKEKIYSMIR